jgi:hypothetical protein
VAQMPTLPVRQNGGLRPKGMNVDPNSDSSSFNAVESPVVRHRGDPNRLEPWVTGAWILGFVLLLTSGGVLIAYANSRPTLGLIGCALGGAALLTMAVANTLQGRFERANLRA